MDDSAHQTVEDGARGAGVYRVSDVARMIGVSASTLRLWEMQGLLAPRRTASGQRRYAEDDLERARRVAWMRGEGGLAPRAIRAALAGPADEPGPDAPETGEALGRRLRALRHAAGLTLEKVAAEVGVAPSALSTLERTSRGVSFGALHRIAAFYDTTVSALSLSPGPATEVVRARTWRTWPATVPGVTVQLLAEGLRQMDCHRFVLAPGAGSEGAYAHDGEEFLHILSGRLEVTLDGADRHELDPGDSIYFESRRHHAWRNASDGETVLLWINTPPTF
ncbi:cupin domain-containing protein [Amaricoccus sp.]|uniref:cupin domain-containing protein n=1 Tax=Amaricoccus sp. TaxID=1872485 RepID=UPI001B4C4B81|nr:cupin domain-containing protein [Amaricoccus sp.]MBP7000450.1 cupin domain-containing protein [Amaricoccus sp.]